MRLPKILVRQAFPLNNVSLAAFPQSAPRWKSTDKMYEHGYAHSYADAVMPQSKMRDLNRGKQLDCTCKQCGYKQHNQQPGVAIEPSALISQGSQHPAELDPVDGKKRSHDIA